MKIVSAKKLALGVATVSALCGLGMSVANAHPVEKEGYLIDTRNNVVKNSYNECWRTGYWTPAMAIAECDPDLVKKEVKKVEPPAPKPEPKPEPEPKPAPAPAPAPVAAPTPAPAPAPAVAPKAAPAPAPKAAPAPAPVYTPMMPVMPQAMPMMPMMPMPQPMPMPMMPMMPMMPEQAVAPMYYSEPDQTPYFGPDTPAVSAEFWAEALFEFDKAVVKPGGKQALFDYIVIPMREHPEVEMLLVTGHTDRIGTAKYNQKLSERRAAAVKNYLVSQGIPAERIRTVGKGESEPNPYANTKKECRHMPAKKLIACLQPDRRVTVEPEVQVPVAR